MANYEIIELNELHFQLIQCINRKGNNYPLKHQDDAFSRMKRKEKRGYIFVLLKKMLP